MFKFISFITVFIINFLLTNQKLCGRYEIGHCIECDNDQEVCSKCENNYFLFFAGLECLNCDDEAYGQLGCEGNCDSSKYNVIKTVLCDKCKEGYYSIEGICTLCSIGSENCVKCSYEASPGSDRKVYKCLECVDGLYGKYRVSNVDGKCRKCSLPSNCLECRYKNGTNDVECIKCWNNYIFIKNDYVCKLPSEVNLNATCEEATRLENGHYSCNKCRKENVLIARYNSINDCYLAENEIVNCEKGYEDENKNLSCIKCLYNYPFFWSEKYQKNICDNKCASDYFFNYVEDKRGCYKCDDESGGGLLSCNPEKGCSFIVTDNRFYCNSCKVGYFPYDGQCLPCSRKDNNCLQCDFDVTEKKFKCTKCINNIYYVNNETGLCDIITYDEYPEVTAGCILPINNYTLYIKQNQCFDCKYGFFKTKDESCIYCKARKNGGPKCDECQYIKDKNGIEKNKFDCKICQNGDMLSPIGKKCYNCEDEVGPGCEICGLDITERVICDKCKEDYYLNENGYCTYYKESDDKLTSNCLIYDNNYSNSDRIVSNFPKCKICDDGYFVNNRGRCESLNFEVCSLNSMFNFEKSIYDECKKFCEMMNYPFVDYKDNNEKIENILKNNLNIIYDSLEEEVKELIENGKLCINNFEENDELKKCIKIEYDSNIKNYKCSKCINGYRLDNSTNRCVLITKIEKAQKECNSETIFIKAEKGTFCEKPIGELEGCANGTIADTQYINTIYNCYNCSSGYKPIYSYYFQRTFCLGPIVPPIENTQQLSSDVYKGIEKDADIEDGKCLIKNAFTPDGENCYLCNNYKVGMPGCGGSCTYSLARKNIIECEGRCISGYLETSKGICESCDIINKGCLNCIYNENYPVGYSDFKRQRRFECIECDEGYQLEKDGYCYHCSELGFTYCDKCIKNKDNNKLECIKCIDGYFLANNGYCTKCESPKVLGAQNRCIFCNNTKEGGIGGCELCFSDNGNIVCQQCKKGFILSEDDKTCIKISDFPELEIFTNCQKVSRDNIGFYKCTKCFENYTYFFDKNRNEEICVNNEFLLTPKPDTLKYCKKAINMGTEDHPKHSCEQCIENDYLTKEQREKGITITKITFPENGTSYCDISSN